MLQANYQKRMAWMKSTICDSLQLKEIVVEESFQYENNKLLLEKFLSGQNLNKIFAYYQVREQGQSKGIKNSDDQDPVLFLTTGEIDQIQDKAVWFLNIQNPAEHQKTSKQQQNFNDNDIIFGEITPNTIQLLNALMESLYSRLIDHMITEKIPFWGQADEDQVIEFQQHSNKFSSEVREVINFVNPASRQIKRDLEVISCLSESEKIMQYELKFNEWMNLINNQLMDDSYLLKEESDAGPATELNYWRNRAQQIANWSNLLKSKDFQSVKVSLQRYKQNENQRFRDESLSRLIMDYNRLDLLLTDRLNEAKDNVKYLTTLEKYIDPLYNGGPQQIIDTLPALMNAIKMIHTTAKYYNTSDKVTGLFIKITNQMIKNCKDLVLKKKGKSDNSSSNKFIWEQDPAELIEIFGLCIKLYCEYKKCYNEMKEKIAQIPSLKTFEFSEAKIFGKFDIFVRRLQKLIEIFSNIQQFNALSKHNLDGMDILTNRFKKIIDDFKKKGNNLLDTTNNKFDRDWVELNVEISQLDTELSNFIDNIFNRFRNIEYSLKLLFKLQSTIKRDSLKHSLASRFNTILHNYAIELETIQRVFQDQKSNPPLVRNMPLAAGKIIWSRHLFQKITGPINVFPQNVINSTEIRRYYGSYNILGKQLTIYEMWYYQDWINKIEQSKSALQATLIVRHDENKKLFVNFDLEIMQLIREAKCLDRQGIEIPESARIILLQEERFKTYYNELLYVIKEYQRVTSIIKPICKNLLIPHIEDLELKLRPGMLTLTWTSMNIETYLYHLHQGLRKLEQLVIKINDIIENRIENNLKIVSKLVLVHLPQDIKPLSLESFVQQQEGYINSQIDLLSSKNVEVERAVDDLLQTIMAYPLDPHVDPVFPEEYKRIKRYYFWYFYQALLNSTQTSLNCLKHSVCGKKVLGTNTLPNLKPFFQVEVQLIGDQVTLSPSLQDIQKSINRAAISVLKCSKSLYNWDQQNKNSTEKATFYDLIACDKEIVKVILLLTGSIQGTKNKVNDFLSGYDKFNWLYQDSIQESLKKFTKIGPTLQNYEEQLKRFSQLEEEIEKFIPNYQIGAMELMTQNIQLQFQSLVKEWKLQYSQDLHKRARYVLDSLTEQTKVLFIKLSKPVKDIDSLGYFMETIEQIRKEQAEIDMKFNPVQEMYSLLDSYLQGGISDKDEMDARSLLLRNWEALIKQAEIKAKEYQEKQATYFKELKQSIKDFSNQIYVFRADYEKNGPMVEGISPEEAMERLRRFQDEYDVKYQLYSVNVRGENLFGLQNQKYPELEKTNAEIQNLNKLYNLYELVIKNIQQFKDKSWQQLTKLELSAMEEDVIRYSDQCAKLPQDLKEWQAYRDLKACIDSLKEQLPVISGLKKPSIQARHWEKIKEITRAKLNYENPEQFKLEDLMGAKILGFKKDIEDVIESAEKELKIRAGLDEINQYWNEVQFQYSNWAKREVPCIINGNQITLIIEKLEEDQLQLSTFNSLRHVTPFKQEVEALIKVFSDVSDTLDMWIKVQKMWTSLEPVFTGGDIARQMPQQAKLFQNIDKNWMKVMEKAVETKKVILCCQNDILKDFLPELNRKLEDCQQMLEAYLEGKRKKFPRFYFLSNPHLLKILSQGSEPSSIQEDLEKLFDAITKVTIESAKEKKNPALKQITAIQQVLGSDEENISLSGHFVKCEGNIEDWLKKLEQSMQLSLKDIVSIASQQVFHVGLKEFITAQPSQIALLGLQIFWTSKIKEGIERLSCNERNAMEIKRNEIKEHLNILSNICLENLSSAIERIKVETLITIQVHQKDISMELKCKDINDFEWQKQTRIEWRSDINECVISITDWDSSYSYEFLGAKERLCITPLTDRCYITLAQAMSMYYGGAPAGPAGTGKTETVKDLGRTLGVFVIVTNCTDQHRYRDMAKIFKGLVQSGLWGCFDEFNRIDLEVLSVVAMQVESITTARKQHMSRFMFPEEEIEISLIPTVSYFITMNPGYAGRQELPENLKVLFRGVSMMVPDREIIIKVKLASVGYLLIDQLAKKFNILYKLCEEQLSKQHHYDFGLRNILSVLRTAGNIKRQEINSDEEMLLMRSLRDLNLPKLVFEDIPLFNSLLGDIFPKQKGIPKKLYPEIEKMISEQINAESHLVNSVFFQLKIIQLYETCQIRHGFMLVGPTGSGKSTVLKILADVLTKQGSPHKIIQINPKAITVEQMYGVKSQISDDWIPGVISTIWAKSNNKSLKHSTWISCDGPVDTIWVENLNTVLDDNKILTLANGERIAMTENCKVVFEVENLNNASPGTVSRCGQVYFSSTDLSYEAIIEGWIRNRKALGRAEESEKLGNILRKYLINMKFIELQSKECQQPMMELSIKMQTINTLNLLTGCLQHFIQSQSTLSEQQYEKFVIFSISWAIGGIYEVSDRIRFHELLASKNAPIPQKIKENETVFDYYVSQDFLDWKLCTTEEWVPPQTIQFSQLLIPTLDSFRVEMLFNFILSQPKSHTCSNSVLLIGGPGTVKTSSVLLYSNKFDSYKRIFKRTNFSSVTSPLMFQSTIESECDFKVGKQYAPPGNKIMTILIDDMSMPFIDKWGDQVTLELVRQLIETGGFYILDKAQRGNQRKIQNLQYIGTMNHPGGGHNDIPNRLKRQFFIFNMILPLSIDAIYGPIIKHVFKQNYFSDSTFQVIESLTSATISLLNKVKSTMLPTPSKFHYIFSMRELARIIKGILSCSKETINNSQKQMKMNSEIFLVGLWSHEAERVLADKLVSSKDKETVLGYIHEVALESFPQIQNQIIEKYSAQQTFLFCDFLHPDLINEDGLIQDETPKIYKAVDSLPDLRKRCNSLLDICNQTNPSNSIPLVLFDEAIKHLLRISRIIRQPRSSGLLIGVGGSGKQSLTRLAGFVGKHIVQQITISNTYSEKDFKEDIKKCFDDAGHLGKQVTFVMTGSQVQKEEFLEYINMVLSNGEIPNLLTKDERDVWLRDLSLSYCKEKQIANIDLPQQELWSYFVDRIKDNFHIILCFSPVGQKLRETACKFPAIFNECTIDWFLPWPEQALISVAETFIKEFNKLKTKEETKNELIKQMANVHSMANEICEEYYQKMRRQVYITPKSFLSYLSSFKNLYIQKYDELDKQEEQFKVGLDKIKETTEAISVMENLLKNEEIQINEATEKTNQLLTNLEKERKKSNLKEEEIASTNKQCQTQAQQISKEKEEAEHQMESAHAALRRVREILEQIEPKDIVELQSGKRLLEIIRYVLDTVLVLFKSNLVPIEIEERIFNKKEGKVVYFLKESYEYGIQVLGDMNFMRKLKEFKVDLINEETIELLEPYFSQSQDWLNDTYTRKASKAMYFILQWVFSIVECYHKSKNVPQKITQVKIAESKQVIALKELDKIREDHKQIQNEIKNIKDAYFKQIEEKNQLEAKAKKTKKKINLARTLIASLQDEKDRWQKGAEKISEQKKNLVGNVSLSSAFINYCGPFNSEYRNKFTLQKLIPDMKKHGISVKSGFELTTFLIDDAVIGEWNLQGLPKDDLSIQNGIILTNSTRYPLLIDPQGQGQNWILNKYSSQIIPERCITTQSHPKFKDMFLKFCMESGLTLIIENIENEVDPMLDSLLDKQISIKGKTQFVNIAGTEFELSKQFKLFMICRLVNPKFSPELSAKAVIIDFTVTQSGLEQQLLGLVISKEQRVLENSLNQLLADANQNQKDLQHLDMKLLECLINSQGNLLDDIELMDILNNTKTQAKEVATNLINAQIKAIEINVKREQYRPVAIRGSAIFFTMTDISLVNWMYNSSLQQFLKLFSESIDLSEKAQLPSARVKNIISFLTFHVYRYVNRGLFEIDKITFIIMMAFKILITSSKISNSDISLFLKSGDALDIKQEKQKSIGYLEDNQWLNILALSKHTFSNQTQPFFKELPDLISRSESQWRNWIEKNDPENYPVPDYAESINQEKEIGSFITLCIVRSLRNDRTLIAAQNFISQVLGKEFTDPITYSIEGIWQESSHLDPILYLLSAGANPTSSIDELAKKKKKFPCEKISMGQGQEGAARQAILKGFEQGCWVILQNCHLGLKFMREVENLVSSIHQIHEDFRLWITCEQNPKFPLGLLQKALKITNEPPKGLKASLNKLFTSTITQEFIDKIDHTNWRSLIFSMCFLHSVVVERKKFGPIGWCVPYEYNNSDLEASLQYVEKYLTNLMSNPQSNSHNLPIQMIVIRYMICEVQYGGRITDDLDRELFATYGETYLKEAIFCNDYIFSDVYSDGQGQKFKYRIPPNPSAEITKYQEFIAKIPSIDTPEVFGLHVNADMTFRLKESKEMINTILSTLPKDTLILDEKTREEIVQDKSKQMLNSLPPDYNETEVKELVSKLYDPNSKDSALKGMAVPLNIFLFQEVIRMQKVIQLVRKTLKDTILAIDGQIILTPEIQEIINAIYEAKVPNQWLYDSSGTEISWLITNLGSWSTSLFNRNKQLNDWLTSGQRPILFWLAGFFNPQGFLTAMKQEVTRNHMKNDGKDVEAWSLEDVFYQTTVKEKDIDQPPAEGGVYIKGLYLEGCKWTKNGLDESDPKKIFSDFPILHVSAIHKKKSNEFEKISNSYLCPVYKYPQRTDKYLIFKIGLPCEGSKSPSHWKLRGVALLCSNEQLIKYKYALKTIVSKSFNQYK
ncbi:hypothetical protein ABPG74_001959 [Tetrahymena malaccensis]